MEESLLQAAKAMQAKTHTETLFSVYERVRCRFSDSMSVF